MDMMIEAEGLQKHFGDVEALAGLDLAVPSGKVLAVLGPERCGQDDADPHDRHAHPTDRRHVARRRHRRGQAPEAGAAHASGSPGSTPRSSPR